MQPSIFFGCLHENSPVPEVIVQFLLGGTLPSFPLSANGRQDAAVVDGDGTRSRVGVVVEAEQRDQVNLVVVNVRLPVGLEDAFLACGCTLEYTLRSMKS